MKCKMAKNIKTLIYWIINTLIHDKFWLHYFNYNFITYIQLYLLINKYYLLTIMLVKADMQIRDCLSTLTSPQHLFAHPSHPFPHIGLHHVGLYYWQGNYQDLHEVFKIIQDFST